MKVTRTKLILLAALFFVLFDNYAFFHQVVQVYPLNPKNIGFLISLAVGLFALVMALLTLLSSRYTTKPVLILLLFISSIVAYFMNRYQVVIDDAMIQNILLTDRDEAYDLLSFSLMLYCFFLGIVPGLAVLCVRIETQTFKKATLTKMRDILLSLLIMLAMLFCFSKFYTSFFRENKPLRYYTNPTYYMYSAGAYIKKTFMGKKGPVSPIGEDARKSPADSGRKLTILVVGEAVRADRLSLNGYERQTTPLLQKEDVISFTDMSTCSTSTADSLPCMFSILKRKGYGKRKADRTENLLDVLNRASVHLLWRDNNSNSQDTARTATYQNYRRPEVNPDCDGECRDEGMLSGLQEYIDTQSGGDIMIVLHQRGNHGPAYFKRYPAPFEKFTPVCRSNQFNECTMAEIGNAYDNAVLYTDYFLSRVIALLKTNSVQFETAMLYISDHGESLGEHNVYLHGLPYTIAPDEQTHAAAVFWFGENTQVNKASLQQKAAEPFSHDNLFHTVLGLMAIETSVYDKSLDILAD